MKKLFCILVLLSFFSNSYGQLYDLIVKTGSDSTVCHIDSITETHIYFEMKYNNTWIHTYSKLDEILEIKQDFISEKHVRFKPGTSIISSAHKLSEKDTSYRGVRKNAIYFEFGGTGIFWSNINYDRIIPINNFIAVVPRIGLAIIDEVYPVIELNFVAGGPHFFETGIGTLGIPGVGGNKDYLIRAGYRYHGKKGLLLRAAPQYYRLIDDANRFWFGLSIGYCFY
jgi:hypothetical protein